MRGFAVGGGAGHAAPGRAGTAPFINHLLSRQLLIVGLVSVGALGIGPSTAYSVLLGGGTSLIANAYFARRVLGDTAPSSGAGLLVLFCWAEFVKVALAAVLIAVIGASVGGTSLVALIAGFLAAHVGGALVCGTGQLERPSDE